MTETRNFRDAAEIFGDAWGYPSDNLYFTPEAYRVDALYRAHLLRAASDRIIDRPRPTSGAAFKSSSGAAIDALEGSRVQENSRAPELVTS